MDALAGAFMATLLVLAMVAWARNVPRAQDAVANLALGIALLFLLRGSERLGKSRLTALLAANAPLAMVPIDWSLDPVVDFLHPRLTDKALLAADRFLFGETPSLLLERWVTPWLAEPLLIGYLSYFALLGLPLILLFLLREPDVHDEYARTLTLLFVMNLSFYVLVPAVGPRFHLAGAYAGPLHGVLFGDRIRDLFLHTPFFRDCFPSGHTAGTLLVLLTLHRRMPRAFWVLLPFGSLCIAATVLCRFHYAIDLICALPLLWVAIQGSRLLAPTAVAARLRTAFD